MWLEELPLWLVRGWRNEIHTRFFLHHSCRTYLKHSSVRHGQNFDIYNFHRCHISVNLRKSVKMEKKNLWRHLREVFRRATCRAVRWPKLTEFCPNFAELLPPKAPPPHTPSKDFASTSPAFQWLWEVSFQEWHRCIFATLLGVKNVIKIRRCLNSFFRL